MRLSPYIYFDDPSPSSLKKHHAVNWVDIGLGILFLAMAVFMFLSKIQGDYPHIVMGGDADNDVILVVQDIHPFVDDRSWLNDFGEVSIAYRDAIQPDPDFGIDMCANVIQYTDGLKIDFNLWIHPS